MPESTHFVQRQPFTRPDAAQISSLMVCAERPDAELVTSIIKAIIQEAPLAIAEDLQTLFALSKEWDKERFNSEMACYMARVEKLVAREDWSPSPALQEKLTHTHLTSADGCHDDAGWLTNFEQQIRSVRYCHLRSIAKKGTDLDGTVQFEPRFTPENHPDGRARIRAAIEVLKQCNIDEQAREVLGKHVPADNHHPVEILCMRPVRDHENSENSYNFQTATYAALLRDALTRVAEQDYPGMFIIKDHPAVMQTFTNRTNASLFGRIIKQPVFNVGDTAGKKAVVIDDHVNAGGFSRTLSAQIEQAGGEVLSVATFSRHQQSHHLEADPKIIAFLQDLYPAFQLNGLLAPVGLSLDTITSREGMTLLSILIDGDDQEKVQRFHALDEALSYPHNHIADGINDATEVELRKPAEPLAKLREDMNRLLKRQEEERAMR